MTILLMLIIMLSGIQDNSQITTPPTSDSIYRAAKYSCLIDLTIAQDLVPGMRSSMVSYEYFIQYGEHVTIDIMLPESGSYDLPTKIVTWDFAKGIFTVEFYFNQGMRYYSGQDSIKFSREDSRGTIEYMCDQNELSPGCDSLRFTVQPSNAEYLVFVSDSLANIPSRYLFYPDIKFLPYRVIRKTPSETTKTLKEIIYGKDAIDSIIHEFRHQEYERISEEEWNSYDQQLPSENKELLDRLKQRLKE